jgi:pimeloyl-ACP methyl ester carboxylesterase
MRDLVTVLLLGLLSVTSISRAQPVRDQQNPQDSTAGISIAAPEGIVEWRDVARGIAGAANLDEEAVAGLFPRGTLNLNSPAAQFIIAGLNFASGGGVNLAIEREQTTARALRVTIDRDALRATLNMLKGIAKQVAFRWGNEQDSRYGLFLDEDWLQYTTERPLVVIIHGYGSKPEEFDVLRERLRDTGFACAVFAYPNDAAVAFSAGQFASALRELERRHPDRHVSLVAHSMGGLVSRMLLEDPDGAAVGNVDQLIMVATPNHGSNLARVPVSLDVWQNWLDGEPDTVRTIFFDSVLDGFNEARLDLQPESELLKRLNGLPRNPNVRYSLLLGNQGPATREQLDELRRRIVGAQNSNVVLQALGPRLDELLEDIDELVDGLGDGAVAVERGRLEGVDDTVVLSFRHATISSALTDESSQKLVAEIVERLNRR